MKAPSEIAGKSVEEIITHWNAELVRAALPFSRAFCFHTRRLLTQRRMFACLSFFRGLRATYAL